MANLDKLSTLIPLELLEQSAQQQIYNALKLEFLEKLIIMPDCHTGYTLPIGGVALLDSVISPEYVGYDIGCGMCYIETDIKVKDFFKNESDKLKIFHKIQREIPVGFKSRDKSLEYITYNSASGDKKLTEKVRSKLYIQLGTLGGGNHFIEVGENTTGMVTITIHSGSRNIGHSIASHYMRLSKIVDDFLPKGFLWFSDEYGQQYYEDMNFALDYALENRKQMMRIVLEILGYQQVKINEYINHHMVNENHNHAGKQFGGILHRKGATPAQSDQIGIIPGSMKAGTYITKGLGNQKYLCSASHGAGRTMSRKKAKENIDIENFRHQMKGIVTNVNSSVLDEAPDAYKNLDYVISLQKDIVIDITDHAKPLIVVKG